MPTYDPRVEEALRRGSKYLNRFVVLLWRLELELLNLSGQPPALVFPHGGLGSLWNPYLQLCHFYGQRELVTYSLAGNGRSDDRANHSLPGHVQDLTMLLRVLSVVEPILVGWSYGVALALEYAKQHPVRGLMLTGGASYGMTPSAGQQQVGLQS